MAELYLLRHYPTDWNIARRIQGHADIPLADNSLRLLSEISLPSRWLTYRWVSSPLMRARQTAEALGIEKPQTVQGLKEMDWGEFEGITLAEIEQEIPARNIQPHTGLHFRPPAGESPAEVCNRLQTWLQEPKPQTTVAVTHKGVIRAAISIATGWDMELPYSQSNHPELKQQIDWLLPLRFDIASNGELTLQQINVALK